jgi:TRAP-type C4-dicarboxylate transport system permease small subunit
MIGKIIDRLVKLQIILATALLALFFVVVCLQVIFRQIGISAIWMEEVAQFSFIWTAFLGGSAMVYNKQHFAFTSLKEHFKGKKRNMYDIAISLAMIIFVSVMMVVGWKPVLQFWNHRWIGVPSFKMGYVWLCVPITGITCTIYLFYHIYLDMVNMLKKDVSK